MRRMMVTTTCDGRESREKESENSHVVASVMADLVVGEQDASGDDGGAHGSATRSMAEKCLSCGDLIAGFVTFVVLFHYF